jgi:phosphoribosylformylglycinamidine synthase
VNVRPWEEPARFRERKPVDHSALENYGDWTGLLKKLLGSPNIASKSWVWEQYDHMVGINTVVRPGSDAAILRLPDSRGGIALTIDCNSRYVYLDPRLGGAIAVAESARNVAAGGAKPLAITNCLNFGNPENPEIYWQFVRATDGMAEACRELSTPVTGGNVSFYNEFDGRAILPTPAIGMVGMLEDVEAYVTSAFKNAEDLVVLVGETLEELGASEAHFLLTGRDEGQVPALDYEKEKRLCAFLVEAAQKRLLASAHDCSEGGLAVALAESAIQGNLGVSLDWRGDISVAAALFGETQSRAVVSLRPENREDVEALLERHSLPRTILGTVSSGKIFSLRYRGALIINCPLDEISGPWKERIACMMK